MVRKRDDKLKLPTVEEIVVKEETVVKEEKKAPVVSRQKPSDTVIVTVKVGTLVWEGGTFEKGEVFKCSRKQAEVFDENDVKIVG